MLFRRRRKPSRLDRLREFFWPRKGLSRPVRYLAKRIARLSATPHAIAVGVAAGTFAAFTPLLGFHIVIAVALAYVLSGNLLAAALSTTLANPLTFPLICVATFRVGEGLLAMRAADTIPASELFEMLEHLEFAELWDPVLKPMLAGSGLLGLLAAFLAYALTLCAVRTFQRRRRERLVERARFHAAAPHPILTQREPTT
jgi:uncharacterized protein (DUF2062 family)